MDTQSLLVYAAKASYLLAAALFILGIKRMSSPVTARKGIVQAGIGMVLATVATFAPFIETMKHGDGPRRLVAIGSVAGIRGMKGAGAYCASKAAVHAYAESLRLELQPHGIRVVTIAPGYIDTPMTRQNRFPMPFLMPAPRFAAAAVRAIDAGTSYCVIPRPMGIVAKGLRLLPNVLFDALFARAPTKAGKATP